MGRGRIQILTQPCKRGCGKTVASASRAIHGSESMRLKYVGICSHCATKEEKDEIMKDQASGILGRKVE